MKPNRFNSFLSSFFLLFAIFVLPSIGQTTENKVNGNKNGANEVSQKTVDSTVIKAKAKAFDNVYRIGFQDMIQVTVLRHPGLSGNFSVTPDGTIFLPRLEKPIMAVCKTERQLVQEIAEAYKKDILKNPFVDVRVVEQKSQAFGVIGAVEKPGYYYLNRKVHLLELLTVAGGPNKEAGTQLIVARTGGTSFCMENAVAQNNNDEEPEIEVLNFKIKDVQSAQQHLWMKPGDIVSILVADPFYVMGNVNKPGIFYLKGPTTLTQALATAEGFKPSSKKDNIRILRVKPGTNEREDLVFNLKKIEKKEIPDPLLEPNDIVAVSEDRVKSIVAGVTKSITGGLGNLPLIIP